MLRCPGCVSTGYDALEQRFYPLCFRGGPSRDRCEETSLDRKHPTDMFVLWAPPVRVPGEELQSAGGRDGREERSCVNS